MNRRELPLIANHCGPAAHGNGLVEIDSIESDLPFHSFTVRGPCAAHLLAPARAAVADATPGRLRIVSLVANSLHRCRG